MNLMAKKIPYSAFKKDSNKRLLYVRSYDVDVPTPFPIKEGSIYPAYIIDDVYYLFEFKGVEKCIYQPDLLGQEDGIQYDLVEIWVDNLYLIGKHSDAKKALNFLRGKDPHAAALSKAKEELEQAQSEHTSVSDEVDSNYPEINDALSQIKSYLGLHLRKDELYPTPILHNILAGDELYENYVYSKIQEILNQITAGDFDSEASRIKSMLDIHMYSLLYLTSKL